MILEMTHLPIDAVATENGLSPHPRSGVPTEVDNRSAVPFAIDARLADKLARFGAVGVVSTMAYLVIFSALSDVVGAQAANFLALLVTAIGNTAANRWFTFGIRGSAGGLRHHCEGLLVFGMALVITSGSLAAVHALVDPTPQWLDLGVLVTANLAATVLRFVLLRRWVFNPHRRHTSASPTTSDWTQP